MENLYTHTTWVVAPEREAQFVELWSDWVEWSRRQGFKAQAMLLRDAEDPRTFVSFGPWESSGAVRNWRTLPGYHERLAKLADVVEQFDPRTLEVVARR
jgi:heme-degrading monooxygenase HmoA